MPLFLLTILNSPWFKYAAGALAGAALLFALFAYGHSKGVDKTELKYTILMNEALEAQRIRDQKIQKEDLVAVTVSATRRAALVETIRTITLPAPDVECSDPVWLHAYNDGVRAVNASTK